MTVCAAVALLAANPDAAGQSASIDYETARLGRQLPISRTAEPIAIDGVLDEPAWRNATIAKDFIQNDPREGEAATHDTEVRVLYDDSAIYFGVFARDDRPDALIISDLKKDFDTGSSDGFRVILDTFRDERNGYQFATNPAGAKWDAQSSNEGRENNSDWDGIWDVRTRVTDDGWYAEIWIPFKTLKFSRADPQTWGINFERKVRRLNEDSYWAPLPRIYNLERVSMAGAIGGMNGIRPGRNIRLKPYMAGSSNAVTGLATEGKFDAGFDVKYGVTSGLTWDFTVNTDFSQVEADEQQVNLSRFSLFFPEKRDFFLENSGIFQFGGGGDRVGGGARSGRQNASQPLRLFFSRRIGLSDAGDAVPILAGTRLTGRLGSRYSLGVLNVQQTEEGDVPATNFTALRARRDILANSDVGVVLLNKEESGHHFNRVAGVDANFRFGFLTLDAYAVQTFSPASEVSGDGGRFAASGHANYQSRVWQFRGRYSAIGQNFIDEMGFVPRTGVNNGFAYVGRTFRPAWFSKFGIRETRPHWQFDTFVRRDGDGLESRYQDWHWPVNFEDGGFLEVGVNPNVEVVREAFTINNALDIDVNPGRYEFNEWFVLWSGNSSAPFYFTGRYSTGEFYDGYRRGYGFGPSIRVNEKINGSLSLQINDIEVSNGSFVTKLVAGRFNYNFNTRMFVNALIQYNTDTRQLSSNLRFNIIHRPLSDFFLVYNDRHDDRTDETNRALIAKVTYLLAF